MQLSASKSYLETEVLTASPQKMQLMLIEGAIRSIERARHHWQAGDNEQAHECLVRAQKIMAELMAGLNHQVAPELTRRVASLHNFVIRTLVDANLNRDPQKLDEALRVLEPQREAWREVCEKLGAAAPLDSSAATGQAGSGSADSPPRQRSGARGPQPARLPPSRPVPPIESRDSPATPLGFSVEA